MEQKKTKIRAHPSNPRKSVFRHLTADTCAHKQVQAQPFKMPSAHLRQIFMVVCRSRTAAGMSKMKFNPNLKDIHAMHLIFPCRTCYSAHDIPYYREV